MAHSNKSIKDIYVDGLLLHTNSTGNLLLNSNIIGSNGGNSFDTIYVDGSATIGNLAIGTIEGTAITLSDNGTVNASNINFRTFTPITTYSTQGTSLTTTIPYSTSYFGSILTVDATISSQSKQTFTVNNYYVDTNSKIMTSIVKYSGTGLPSVYVSNIGFNVYDITLVNNSTTESLNEPVEIGFMLFQNNNN